MPDFLLFAQHGWFDTSHAIARLARAIATPTSHIITPNLGYTRIWLRMEPLIKAVEQQAHTLMQQHPSTPIRVIAHSMGGLLWLEVLQRHPEWWPRLERLVLLGSPVGGVDLARIIDPFGWGIGIARDLGQNRRALAETIASSIPTLAIAGDADGGGDGLITVEATRMRQARWVCLPGLWHPALRNHPRVAAVVRAFWACPGPSQCATPLLTTAHHIIERLRRVPGMTDGHQRGVQQSQITMRSACGLRLRTWRNPVGVEHVFVTDSAEHCLFAGFVGWVHTPGLRRELAALRREYGASS